MLPPLVQAVAGGTAAAVASTAVYPLDLATSRIQTSSSKHTDLAAALKRVVDNEGVSALWSGVGSDALSTFTNNFVFFYCTVFFRKRIAKLQRLPPGKAPILNTFQEIALGSICGMISKGITMPLSTLVVRMQTSSEDADAEKGPTVVKDRASIASILRGIYEEQGLWAFWSGYKAACLLTLNPSLTMHLFELLERFFLPRSRRQHPPATTIFAISAFATSLASLCTYPLILAKTRLQSKSRSGKAHYQSTRQVLHAAYQQQRIPGLYVGLQSYLSKKVVEQGATMVFKSRLELFIVSLYRHWLGA